MNIPFSKAYWDVEDADDGLPDPSIRLAQLRASMAALPEPTPVVVDEEAARRADDEVRGLIRELGL